MSRIPKSFATPTSRLPAPSVNFTDPSKVITQPVKKNVITNKSLPLSDIKINSLGGKTSTAIKRSAPAITGSLPNKQVKLTNKPITVNKIPPHDYKARFNDLSEKFKKVKDEFADLKEKYDECSDELESLKSSYDSLSQKESEKCDELHKLIDEHNNLTEKHTEISNALDSQKISNDILESQCKVLTEEKSVLNKSLDECKERLRDVESKLSCKTSEYETLKIAFEREVKKCLELTSRMEENQIKLLSTTSEVSFLKNQHKAFEQKIQESDETIKGQNEQIEELASKVKQYEECNGDLGAKLTSKISENNDLTLKLENSVEKCKVLTSSLSEKNEQVIKCGIQIEQLQQANENLKISEKDKIQQIITLENQNRELLENIQLMFENQKKLRNTIQDLKGHIRVFCRIRPPLPSESSKPLLSVDILDSCSMEVDKNVGNSTNGLNKKTKLGFTFDGIFPPNCPQLDVFDEVSGLIQSAMDGYNVCIFAYGQTGSGKTYTMEGLSSPDNMGIIPRAIDMIFKNLPNLKLLGWEFKITASFLEIYNEIIYDLLDSSKDQNDHSIKMADSKGEDVYVSNLKEEIVNNAQDLKNLLIISQKNRQTAATICNERSSRSHSVTKIKFSAYHAARGEQFFSNLNLVDLAGSESAKTSQRMDETKSINKSLLELSKVILALQSKQSHVPYRNSKLTYLLMPSLGGNSKTLMLVNIAQLDESYQETLNSLRFAAKVNSCKVGVTKKNITTVKE